MNKILIVLLVITLCLGTAMQEVSNRPDDVSGVGDTQGTALQTYILHVADQENNPVPGVYVNFCTDTAWTLTVSDKDGTVTFDGTPDVYHIQLLKVPEGYSFDEDFEMYTDPAYGEWVLHIRKD